MRIFLSSFQDIATNLAVEDVVLDETERNGPALLFSRNRPSVVFGKNQNAWREARPGRLLESGIAAARRDSGGGTVYHDAGNLNFSFLLPRAEFDRDRQFRVLLRALARLGVTAAVAGGSSLTVAGRKISGSAFTLRRTVAAHHGTMLFVSDLDALSRAIEPPAWSVEGRGVASVRMEVTSLARVAPALTEAAWIERLAAEAVIEWGGGERAVWADAASVNPAAVAERKPKWEDWDWAWGHSPDCELASTHPDGRSICVRVRAGRVETVRLHAASGAAPESVVSDAWTGHRFGPETPPPPELDSRWRDFLIGFCRGDA